MANGKIDVHAHFITSTYRKALLEHGYAKPDGMPGIPRWSEESHLAFMNSYGIAKSIISVSSPGTNITSNRGLNQNLTRESNEYAAHVKARYPDRFGYFASLPLPDISASLAEIKHVLDGPLKADGIILLSNASGFYLGDPHLRPILAELDSRKAVVFVHPTGTCCQANLQDSSASESPAYSSPLASAYPDPVFEFFFDSGRSILDMIMTGTACRFSQIRWIITHCGGALASLLDRVIQMASLGLPLASGRDPLPVSEAQIRAIIAEQFWFDLAGNPIPNQVDAILRFTSRQQLLFGTDVPWMPFEVVGEVVQRMERDLPDCVGKEHSDPIFRGNAEQLLLKQVEN
ncbi:hypothetical protein JMJ35_005059 [Cladonia borealis]|uniref:6-methylsalicylate decarboxylase n=1 Tax=Cladonia borealis TaxID=184061 RepID=A0AA39V297_9LECA|nr:hypothetical protein JMJ35_005059 [Cladonia borealis]